MLKWTRLLFLWTLTGAVASLLCVPLAAAVLVADGERKRSEGSRRSMLLLILCRPD